jgi:hypothetical protein
MQKKECGYWGEFKSRMCTHVPIGEELANLANKSMIWYLGPKFSTISRVLKF